MLKGSNFGKLTKTAIFALALLMSGVVLGLPQTVTAQLPNLRPRDTCGSTKSICEWNAQRDYNICRRNNSPEQCDKEKQEDLDRCQSDYNKCKGKSKNLAVITEPWDVTLDSFAMSLDLSGGYKYTGLFRSANFSRSGLSESPFGHNFNDCWVPNKLEIVKKNYL